MLAVAAAGLLLFASEDAEASHWRGGAMYYEHVDTDPATGETTVRIQGKIFGRLSWAGMCTAPCNVGQVQTLTGGGTMRTGMPTGVGPTTVTFHVRVISVHPDQDWVAFEIVAPGSTSTSQAGVLVTYPSPDNNGDPWHPMFRFACCRTSNGATFVGISWHHINNPDRDMLLWINVTATDDNSGPTILLPPIVDCEHPGICTFPVGAIDPEGHTMEWRFSTALETTGVYPPLATAGPAVNPGAWVQPGPPNAPQAATINNVTGIFSWDTTGTTTGPWPPPANTHTVYSVTASVEDGHGARSVADWFIRLVPPDPHKPHWVTPPSQCGDTIGVFRGGTLNYQIRAASTDSTRVITLYDSGIPAGASMVYDTPNNPVNGYFTWTTTPADVGTYIVLHWGRDDKGSTTDLCVMYIRVHSLVADFDCETMEPRNYRKVKFTDASYDERGHAPVKWSWVFEGGGTASIRNPTHQFPQGDRWYDVTLTVQNERSDAASVTKSCYSLTSQPPTALDGVTAGIAGRAIQFQLQATDPEGDPLIFHIANNDPEVTLFPSGFGIWQTSPAHAGVKRTVQFMVEEDNPLPDKRFSPSPGTMTLIALPPEGGPAVLFDSTGDGLPDLLDPCPDLFTPGRDPSVCQFKAAGGGLVAPRPRQSEDPPGFEAPQPTEEPPEARDAPQVLDWTDSSGDGIPDRLSRCPHLWDPFQLAGPDCTMPRAQQNAAGDPRTGSDAPGAGSAIVGPAGARPQDTTTPAPGTASGAIVAGGIGLLAILALAAAALLLLATRRQR